MSSSKGKTPDGHDSGDARPRKDGESAPRLPHEHDQSADSQVDRQPVDQGRAEKAHDDIERGVVDTDKGPVIDQVYDKVRKSSPDV
ncbi:MAG: hypothetical protein J0H69_22160 [Burkholderiales bacterium]|nr:hypothetical protein [Burkholderiales bacterium]